MITTEEYLELYKKSPWYSEPYEGQEEDKEKIREYNKMLIKKYPWLEPRNRWSGKKISDCANGEKGYWPGNPDELPEWDWSHTELDDMPDGWRVAFGDQLCEEIQKELEKFDYVDKYMITQIKEKYGYLHWYDNGIPIGKLSEDYEEIISDTYVKDDEDTFTKYVRDTDDGKRVFHRFKILEKCHVWDIIHKYEDISETVCIRCGKPAKWVTRGWISYYCDDCKKKLEEKIYDTFEPIEEESNE